MRKKDPTSAKPEDEDLAKFDLLFENSPVGIIQVDSNLNFIDANPTFCSWLGYTIDELRTKSVFDVTYSKDLERTKTESHKFKSKEFVLNRFQKRYLKKDGSVVWGQVTSRSFSSGKGYSIFSSIEDITTIKKFEAELVGQRNFLRENYECFRTLFDFSPYPYVVFDEGGVVDCNHAAAQMLGFSIKSDLIAKNLMDFSPEVQPDGSNSIARNLEIEASVEYSSLQRFEWLYRRTDGRGFMVEVTLTKILLNQKNVRLVMWKDLTQIKANERALVLSAKMSSLGEMASGVAHEVNNPLAIISGKTENLIKKVANGTVTQEQLRDDLDKIKTTTLRIAKIVKGLSSFSRNSENEPMEISRITTIIDDTLELCRERFRLANIELRVNCEDVQFESRPTQISQVIMNLLSNSYDAVSNLPQKWVEISVKQIASKIQIKFTDSGNGIERKIVDKMMEPFFTTKEVGKGTGLGLSISKGIVDGHGGTIKYDITSQNTCFIIEIPTSQEQASKPTQTKKAA